MDIKRLRVNQTATLSQQLQELLEEAISDGRIPPGERMQADQFATHFGVSRIPVREALQALQANGWVEMRPRRGMFVPKRTSRELDQLFEMRLILEVEAARLAAERRTRNDLRVLDQIVAQGVSAVRRDDLDRLPLLNQHFHSAVAVGTQNQILARANQDLGKRVHWYFATALTARGRQSKQEHPELAAAIRDQDSKRAAEIARDHISKTRVAVSAA